MSEIKVGENETLENALRRFKKKCARAGVLSEVRKREHYEKPSVKKRKNQKLLERESLNKLFLLKEGIKNMPTIKENLQEDWKNSLKAKDKFRANVISTAKSAILLVEKTNNIKLEDEQVVEILAKEIKQRRESLVEFEKGKRQDLVDQCNSEIEILLEYLPQQLSEDEIRKIIQDSAIELGANSIKDMGKVMSSVRPKIIGRADGKHVSELVKQYLTN